MQSWTLEGPLQSATATVQFTQQGDRIAHEVRIQPHGGGAELVWNSVEGTDAEDWPLSPPYQELMMQEIGGRQVALLVGMAGKSHWSLSVDIDSQRNSVRFDAACRIATTPRQLGSTYRGPTAPSIVRSTESASRQPPVSQPQQSRSADAEPNDPGEPITMDLGAGQYSIRLPGSLPCPATIRWVYEFSLDEAGVSAGDA